MPLLSMTIKNAVEREIFLGGKKRPILSAMLSDCSKLKSPAIDPKLAEGGEERNSNDTKKHVPSLFSLGT